MKKPQNDFTAKQRKVIESKNKQTRNIEKSNHIKISTQIVSYELQTDSQQDKSYERQQKQIEHNRFLKMILTYKATTKQVLQLQKIKQNTQLEIHLRYLKSTQNKVYKFPFKKSQNQSVSNEYNLSKKVQNKEIQQQENKKNNKNLNQMIQSENLSLLYMKQDQHFQKNQQNSKQIKRRKSENYYEFFANQRILSSQTESDISTQLNQNQRDQDILELKKLKNYDLRSQNQNEQNKERFSLSKLVSFSITPKKQQKIKFFKHLPVVELISKTLSLETKALLEKNFQNKIQKSRIKTLDSQEKNESLETLRIARLLQKQKHLLAIRSQPKLKAKNFYKSYFSPLQEQKLYEPLKIHGQNKKHNFQNNDRLNQNYLQSDLNSILDSESKLQSQLASAQKKRGKQFFDIMMVKPKSQKKLNIKNPEQILLPNIYIKKQKSENQRQVTKSLQKKNKKLKTLESDLNIYDGIYQLIGKKLKTQTNTPQNRNTPLKFKLYKHSIQDQADLSLIFSNDKFKNLNLYIDEEKQKMFGKTKKKVYQNQRKVIYLQENDVYTTEQKNFKNKKQNKSIMLESKYSTPTTGNKNLSLNKKIHLTSNTKDKISVQKLQRQRILSNKGISLKIKGRQKSLIRKNNYDDDNLFGKITLKEKLKC